MQNSKASFPRCVHFGKCAGCTEHLSLSPPPVWKEMLSFFEPYSSSVPSLHAGNPLHWRHRAKVAVRGSPASPLIGLFERSSHHVFPIPECLVHHPQLNQAFEFVRAWMKKHAITPYEEKTGKGDLRYLQGVVERTTGRVQLALVSNSSLSLKDNRLNDLVEQLGKEHSSFWHSLWINSNDRPVNTIFGPHWLRLWGEEYLWETFEDISACYGPASFGQANLPLFERMLVRIRELLPQQAQVAEFYAGVGVIGLFIASRCRWVRCSEINPFAEHYFQQAVERLPSDTASRLTFSSGSTREALSLLEDARTVIVDPPRKGLESIFFEALQKASTVQQFIYISCGWDAFKKDFQRLREDGWKIQSVDGYLFFPGSHHVELLVCFER